MRSTIINADSIDGLVEQIDREIEGGFEVNLAFVYSSVAHDIGELVESLKRYKFLILGATTAGEIFANEEYGINEKEETILSMLISIDPEAIALKLSHVNGDDHATGREIGLWARDHFDDATIITTTAGLAFDNDFYMQGILSSGVVYVFGGAAGDDLMLKDTFVFSGEEYSRYGVVALAIDNSKIDILGARAFGWVGIGKERIVTKASKNIVYEIDDIPAVEFYKNYLQVDSVDIPQVGIEYPLEVTMLNGEIVYRAVTNIGDDNSLIFAGHVEERSKVRISAPQGRGIIDHVSRSISDSLLGRDGFTPEIALVFSCCSRKQVLGPAVAREIEEAYRVVNSPLVGLFVYGEIGAFPGGHGFHNETFVTVMLSERSR